MADMSDRTPEELAGEIEELRARLEEAEETLQAIRSGEIDAVIASGPQGDQVFTLKGADHVYRMMVEQMSEAAVTMTVDGLILFCNVNLSRLLRSPLERVQGRAFQEFVSPQDQALFGQLLRHASQDKAKGEILIATGSGKEIPAYLSLSALHVDDKTIVSMLITDLSEQKRTEELLSSGKLSSAILEQAAEAIVVCDMEGVVIRASSYARRLCGKDPIGAKFEDAFPLEAPSPQAGGRRPDMAPDSPAGFIPAFLASRGYVQGTEVRLRLGNGHDAHMMFSACPVQGENEEPLGWVVTMTDITDRKKMEGELRRTKEEAETANQAKSDFLANMSHEIRTPMNGIMGLSELILLEDIPPRAREYLQLIKQSGLNLLAIINDILDLSKIESGHAELERKAFDPRDIVESTLAPLAVSAAGKGLRFSHDVAPDVPSRIVGDQGRLRQVLTNLVGNAVKFTSRGLVSVAVRVAETPEPHGVRLFFRISDTGIGVPADKQEHIFESFAQVGSSAHMQYGGTGLGLAISKSLVEMMGGKIQVESMAGRGSTFSFTAAFALAEETEPAAPEDEAAATPRRPEPLRILLAEDDKINRLLAVELLQKRGHRVETAANGREALEKLKAETFDLVLMDVRMPDMSGEEAVRAIRRGEAGRDKAGVKVAALTAHALKGDRERFLAVGMDDYMAKPIDMEELDRVLERIMAKRGDGELHPR